MTARGDRIDGVQVSLMVDQAAYDALKAMAEKEDRKVTQEIRRAIRFYLEERS